MRTTPYTESELKEHLSQGTEDQNIDTLSDHIRRGGQVKASILLHYTSCDTVQACMEMIELAKLKNR